MNEETTILLENLVLNDECICKFCDSYKYNVLVGHQTKEVLGGFFVYEEIIIQIYCKACGKEIPHKKYTKTMKKVIQEKKIQYQLPFHKRIKKYWVIMIIILVSIFFEIILELIP